MDLPPSAPSDEPLNDAELAVGELLTAAHLAASHELPALLSAYGARLGVEDATGEVGYFTEKALRPAPS